MPLFATITKSNRKDKRFKVVVVHKITGQTKTIHFGQKNGQTFLDHNDEVKKKNYLARHSKLNEDWKDPFTAGYWARWFLWSAKDIDTLIKMFRYKGIDLL